MVGTLGMASEMEVIPEMVDTREMAICEILGTGLLIGTEEAIPEKMVGINRNVAKNVIHIEIVKIIEIIIEIVKIKPTDILGIPSLNTRRLEVPTPEVPTPENLARRIHEPLALSEPLK